MKRNFILQVTAVVLFVLLFVFGLQLAQRKPLWNDELYSQVNGIQKMSYAEILLGHIPEGNNSPLFYVLQKAVCDLTHFKLPFVWNEQWSVAQPQGQLILRLMPNFFMSLSLAVIFYVLAVEYSFIAGVYAFLTALASSAVWMYWVEARPYALWFALTTSQILYFLRFIHQPDKRLETWRKLACVHILLSITAVFGAVQVFIVSLILLKFYEKKFARYFFVLFLPLSLGFFYFFNAPHYVFGLPQNPWTLIFANIPVERFLFIIFCGILALNMDWKCKKENTSTLLHYAILTVLFLGAVVGIMVCFALTADRNWQGFLISSRYFIFLAPVGIIGISVFLFELFKRFAGQHWMIINFGILALGLLVLRSLKVILEIFALGIY